VHFLATRLDLRVLLFSLTVSILTGLLFGSAELPGSSSVKAFVEGLAALAEIGLFFALGLLVFPLYNSQPL